MQDIHYKSKPIDPTQNAEDVLGDTSGKTGITTSQRGSTQIELHNNKIPSDPDQNGKTLQDVPDEVATRSEDIATEPDEFDPDRNSQFKTPLVQNPQSGNAGKISLSGDPDIQNYQYTPVPPPNYVDEQSAMGTNPDPESDDDVDLMAASVGLYDNADSEFPEELDIAGQINADEEELRYT